MSKNAVGGQDGTEFLYYDGSLDTDGHPTHIKDIGVVRGIKSVFFSTKVTVDRLCSQIKIRSVDSSPTFPLP